jgi:hypothetical protein
MKINFPTLIVLAGILSCGNKNSAIDPALSQLQSSQKDTFSKGDTLINFQNSKESNTPIGFLLTFTGKEQIKDWKIVDDDSNMVAAQLTKNGGDNYNLLVLEQPVYKDLKMSVKIKSISGEEDQGGGLVWRFIDNNNYYIARYNPLESNFRFYRVVNGSRKQLLSESIDIPSKVWFTMSIEMIGNKISCYLNANKMIETTDDTFIKPGRIGFWTKADAVTYFDELTISALE